MPFSSEAQLVAALLRNLPRTILRTRSDDTPSVVREMQLGPLVPDIVFVSKIGNRSRIRTISSLSVFDRWVLSEILTEGEVELGTIADHLATSEVRTLLAISKLRSAGLIRQTRDGLFTPISSVYLRAEVISVEAKLSKWREAISQATRYLTFSTASYVALPSALVYCRPVLREACRLAGIGLLAVDRAKVTVVHRSARHEPNRRDWLWAVGKASASWPLRSKTL